MNDQAGVETAHLRVAELVRGLHNRSDTDSDTVVAELAEHAAVEIPGAQYAGITLSRNAKQIETPAATHHWPLLLDKIQQRHLEGPCLSAAWDEKTVHVADLETEERFPNYRRDALSETPIRSIMAFQMFIAGETIGALNVYSEQPGAFGSESRNLGLIFAAHTSVAWNSARRDEQFRRALSSRDMIGQAKGMIMERYGVDAVQAFELLRKLSQDSNVPLIQVATDLVSQAQSPAK
ncbi:GAF and ANTAR domain-containing protein [Mycolicibacterium pyrenivorans]|uniref:GAF and ANTAR domain-containing protein n=1 Tax=Mycolicibacterium pyrenivorans TaxID=187102 RepID=UPI0021F2C35A|nr:GAF and ANTAR domain-containing protein [Mycolicibacterium pyrenivorans]MCV7150246.1 GAF and ANTAR domain-containing protein [Mycolicibacterium pyrenivorans]